MIQQNSTKDVSGMIRHLQQLANNLLLKKVQQSKTQVQ